MIIDKTKYWGAKHEYYVGDDLVAINTREGILPEEYMGAVNAIVEAAFDENGNFTPESIYPAKVYAAILYFTDFEDKAHMWELGTMTDFMYIVNEDSHGLVKRIWEEADREIDRRIDPMNKIVDYIGKLKTSTESILESLNDIDRDFILSKVHGDIPDDLSVSDLD